MTLLRKLFEVASHNWPQKVGAVLLAVVMWLFITTNSVSITQRSLLVPLVTEGLEAGQVAAGVPSMVEVNVSGPNARINRLRSENLTATLDLSDVLGEFREQVVVQPPQGITLVKVNPDDVIGFVESITHRTLGVTPSLTGPAPDDVLLSIRSVPDVVEISGRSQVLQRVARVLVTAPAREGDSVGHAYAVDSAGVPVADVNIEPRDVALSVSMAPALSTRLVTLRLETLNLPPQATATLDQTEVTLAGPSATLAAIDTLVAEVDALSGSQGPGRYTVPIRLDLPPGVAVIGTPTAELRYDAPPNQD